jgi:seryl-tRNA synthetase
MDQDQLQKLDTTFLKVNILERDVDRNIILCEKLSESIQKMQELNISIMQMIKLHEQRHQNHENVDKEVKDDIKELHSRITTVNRELYDKIEQVERHITDRLDNLRNELINHEKNDKKTKIGDTLKEIDKYKYLILGGATAIGWLLGNINLTVLETLIK